MGANGTRFHAVEAGTGPLVLLLHGFPEFWWAWHDLLPGIADAGFRAVAVDIRGYGASDKPPRGYDGYTMAADITGLIRALGERSAVIVGTGFGGMLGWTAAAFHPRMVRRLVVLGAPHPLRLRAALFADPRGSSPRRRRRSSFRSRATSTRSPRTTPRSSARSCAGAPGRRGLPAPNTRTTSGAAVTRCRSLRRRSARWRRTGGPSGRCCACTATAS
ncbi:hypothetical protein Phou_034070 [Phytohabitans houttuyneae]|uniref:AB hydrolase-1 domain-containing protein n=1 Tax=Phytohabitans houttuyneae TaxID=1076126 RepID=A0A6V8KBX8_9ACTN|nr:hypothetical protein Phou_034070 [Phytohabitans houttuyneae]